MVAEIAAGWLTGSMALLADGFHMATHAGALMIAGLAYAFARRQARNARFTFGTGKVGDLAGFASAILLAVASLGIAAESVTRLFALRPINYADATLVAFIGLAVNLVSAWMLMEGGSMGMTMPHMRIMAIVMVLMRHRRMATTIATGTGTAMPTPICVRPICMCSPMR